jgi:hypothetical protein
MLFRAVDHIDVFELSCSLRPRMNLFGPAKEGVRLLGLRWADDGVWKAHKETRKWTELRNSITRIKRLGKALLPDEDLEEGAIFLEMLDPGSSTSWSDDPVDYLRVVLPIRTNPRALMHAVPASGLPEAVHLPQGQLTLCAPALSSATNLGQSPRVHLCINIRQKQEERP